MADYDVIVVGGGASGMMAAGRAAETGCRVLLLEKMLRLGSKLSITGKGRCNITNIGELDSFLLHYGENGKFLHNCYARFFNRDLIDFFKEHGVATVVERGGRVFPVSGEARSIVKCLKIYVRANGVHIRTGCRVDGISVGNGKVSGVEIDGESLSSASVILATGGLSYPATGSTGDGYRFALDLGHRIRKPEANLVPIEIAEHFVQDLQGVDLENVELSAFSGGRRFARASGDMLFTHFGVSGPIVLTMSREIVKVFPKHDVKLVINFKPALTRVQVEQRLLREFTRHGRKKYKTVMRYLLPTRLVDTFVRVSGVRGGKKACEIDRMERQMTVDLLRGFPLTVKRIRPIDEAIVTAGGVALEEIDPLTMQSRLVKGLFFCGEMIDIDGDTGGYNLQAAFSTGYVAGESACSICK